MSCRVCQGEVEVTSAIPDICRTSIDRAGQTHGLGDKIASVAKTFGFKQTPNCRCADRQKALNRLDLSGPRLEVAKAFVQAIINPPKKE